MTEAPFTSASGNNEQYFPTLLFIIMVLVAAILIVIFYLLLEFCLRHLEYRRHALRNQDPRHHPHDVESGQVTGRLEPATLSMLKLYYVQIDESSVNFSSGCVICLDDFQKGENCCVLSSCKHVFHSGCFMQWLDKNQSCPLCRDPV